MDSVNQQKLISEIESLFTFASPSSLRKSITFIYHDYISRNSDILPSNFKVIAGDMFYLIEFLEKVEDGISDDESEVE